MKRKQTMQRKSNSKRMIIILSIAVLCLFGHSIVCESQKYTPRHIPININALPEVNKIVSGIGSIEKMTGNKLVVHQNQEKAVIDWKSFNIGEKAWTHFDQRGNSTWSALNRIYDQNPSMIYGRLTADGKIFLINQNGILFGPGARVNVHTLVASSLDIDADDYLKGRLNFTLGENGGAIENQGRIETETGGAVFLFGPSVGNYGRIDAPLGQIALAAGTEIDLISARDINDNLTRIAKVVNVKANPGDAVNQGELLSDLGLAGMYGRWVRQEGLIRSMTAIKRNGAIELLATERVTTGKDSVTACPVSDSAEEVHQSASFTKSSIIIDGLDPERPLAGYNEALRDRVGRVELNGSIEAPSGDVKIQAKERVYMADGSRIDVSGAWATLPAEENIIKAQLNSVEMRDDYGQKDGILKGEQITFNAMEGSSIGNIAPYLSDREQTAVERSTEGGNVTLMADSGDVIVREGATIDFSGGGIHYQEGVVENTQLLSGDAIHDMDSAPQWTRYDAILKDVKKGVLPAYDEGHDAGIMTVKARRVVLDGELDGSVTQGPFQTEFSTPKDELGFETSRGVVRPKAGRLDIGEYDFKASPIIKDLYTDQIFVKEDVIPLPDSFGPDDPLPEGVPTIISSHLLNDADLNELRLYSNNGIVIDAGVSIQLSTQGAFHAAARSIVHKGEIYAPGGDMQIYSDDTITAFETYMDLGTPNPNFFELPDYLPDGIRLEAGSILSAAGERDTAISAEGMNRSIEGGAISILDRTYFQERLEVERGALIDVSGGYAFDPEGDILAGDAGRLQLASKGLSLEGDLRGHSLAGKSGGALSIHTGDIHMVDEAGSMPDLDGKGNIFQDDLLAETGFSDITLKSEGNMLLGEGVHLVPSQTKLADPSPYAVNESGESQRYITPPDHMQEPSGIKLYAGVHIDRSLPSVTVLDDAYISVAQGAKLETSTGGKITMEAPQVTMGGALEALAGTVTLKATEHDLILEDTGRILASGVNKPGNKPLAGGLPLGYTPLAGGAVTLESNQQGRGNIVMEEGLLIDVSGSDPVNSYIEKVDKTFDAVTVASDAGKLTLSFGGYLNPKRDNEGNLLSHGTLEGVTLLGHGKIKGAAGGELVMENKNIGVPLIIHPEELKGFTRKGIIGRTGGFDALTLRSAMALHFAGSLDLSVERTLTLDAPLIDGLGAGHVNLRAPLIALSSSRLYFGALANGDALLSLAGNWIDIEGDVRLAGFDEVVLNAATDLKLSDRFYTYDGQQHGWHGGLSAPCDLTLQADRIYPTTLSQVTIHSDKKVTILPGDKSPSDAIYSAGGRLTIEGENIEHRGYLAAPMGEIVMGQREGGSGDLQPSERILLGEESVTTTAGQTLVKYGEIKETTWEVPDKESLNFKKNVASIPDRAVTINGKEVIMTDSAEINCDGGGEIFAYQFLSGIEGTVDPLSRKGVYVILPDNSVTLPGRSIYIEGAEGIPEGSYSLLPEYFAFVPGAMVIADLGAAFTYRANMLSVDGSPVTRGYAAVSGTGFQSSLPHLYSITPAEKVTQRGNYSNSARVTLGDAGSISVEANTAVLEGIISGRPIADYKGYHIQLSGRRIFVGSEYQGLHAGFSFYDEIPADLKDSLYIDSSAFSEKGFNEVSLGVLGAGGNGGIGTASIVIQDGSVLKGDNLTLAAAESIQVNGGAQIHASGDPGLSKGVLKLLSPTGQIIIEEDALVKVNSALNIECAKIGLSGDVEAEEGSALRLASARILLAGSLQEQGANGMTFTPEGFKGLSDKFSDILLAAHEDFVLETALNIELGDTFTLDTPKIVSDGLNEGDAVSFSSGQIFIQNTSEVKAVPSSPDNAQLSFNAQELVVGHGNIAIDGFKTTELKSERDVTLRGKGSLTISGDELNVTAARMTTASYQDAEAAVAGDGAPYEVANFEVNVPDGVITIKKSGGIKGDRQTPGGILKISGRRIVSEGIVEVQSGRITLDAEGAGADGGVLLGRGSEVLASGTRYTPGGHVRISTEEGDIQIEGSLFDEHGVLIKEGALIDVSSGIQGDAGRIVLSSPKGDVRLDGKIEGEGASEGNGGSFALDAARLSGEDQQSLSSLNQKLKDGGFDHEIDLHIRDDGKVTLAEGVSVDADQFKLVNDGGAIEIRGSISTHETGRVEVYARDNVTLYENENTQDASGIKAPDGEVVLGTAKGELAFEASSEGGQGALIDVGGNAGVGTVTLQAPRENGDVRIHGKARIEGASKVIVEAFEQYDKTSGYIAEAIHTDSETGDTIVTATLANLGALNTATASFMGNAGAIEARLLSALSLDEDIVHVRPGIEIQYAGAKIEEIQYAGTLRLGSVWNLSDWRYNGEPGALSLRAVGDLAVDQSLFDRNDSSWRLNMVAGADLGSADPLAVKQGYGNLSIANNIEIYTKDASLSFASGKDTAIGRVSTATIGKVPYNMGTYSGPLQGKVGGSLKIYGGAIQSATGDIEIEAGNDLILESSGGVIGSIRTVGELPSDIDISHYYQRKIPYWEYASGGDIDLSVGGRIGAATGSGLIDEDAWDYVTEYYLTDENGKRINIKYLEWSASYENKGSEGINVTQGLATMGGGDLRISAGLDVFTQIGAFGKGDLRLFSGGDIDGKFLIRDGSGYFSAMGDFGKNRDHIALEAFDTEIDVIAQGNIHLGTIVNPQIARKGMTTQWNLTYSPDSRVSLRALGGDVTLSGQTQGFLFDIQSQGRLRILPPTLEIEASRDVRLSNSFVLAPSETGNLTIRAGRDIDGLYGSARASVLLSDLDPSDVYGKQPDARFDFKLYDRILHADTPVHMNDDKPVTIQAGRDIRDLRLYLAKSAEISANGDIRDIEYLGQNVRPVDATIIRAGDDISFGTSSLVQGDTGIEHGGPGSLLVQAGDSMDLGVSKGIQSIGNFYNIGLGLETGPVAVFSGFYLDIGIEEVEAFFAGLEDAGETYSSLLNKGELDLASDKVDEIRRDLIRPLYDNAELGEGDIDMVDSQIVSKGEGGDLYILANGDLNVGRTTFAADPDSAKNSGIYTATGGDISIFANGDINVNESRVMTFRGGDVSVWSDEGDINAGRGSKTVTTTEPPKVLTNKEGEVVGILFDPPAVGSGIRTLSYDPDGIEGPLGIPEAGDIFLYAPTGEIDAGEAGISGRNIILAAKAYKNVQNISFSEGSVGVPAIADGAEGLAGLTGTSGLTETTKAMQQTMALDSAQNRVAANLEKMADAFTLKGLIKVQVIGFDGSEKEEEDAEEAEERKRKQEEGQGGERQ